MAKGKLSYEFLNAGGEVVRITEKPDTLRITEIGNGHMEARYEDFTPEMKVVLGWHGMKQVFGDEMAGKDSTIQDAQARHERMLAGEWRSIRESGGGILALAVSRCRPDRYPTQADAAKRLAQLTDEQVKALSRDKEVAHCIDTIRAERRDAAPASTVTLESIAG